MSSTQPLPRNVFTRYQKNQNKELSVLGECVLAPEELFWFFEKTPEFQSYLHNASSAQLFSVTKDGNNDFSLKVGTPPNQRTAPISSTRLNNLRSDALKSGKHSISSPLCSSQNTESNKFFIRGVELAGAQKSLVIEMYQEELDLIEKDINEQFPRALYFSLSQINLENLSEDTREKIAELRQDCCTEAPKYLFEKLSTYAKDARLAPVVTGINTKFEKSVEQLTWMGHYDNYDVEGQQAFRKLYHQVNSNRLTQSDWFYKEEKRELIDRLENAKLKGPAAFSKAIEETTEEFNKLGFFAKLIINWSPAGKCLREARQMLRTDVCQPNTKRAHANDNTRIQILKARADIKQATELVTFLNRDSSSNQQVLGSKVNDMVDEKNLSQLTTTTDLTLIAEAQDKADDIQREIKSNMAVIQTRQALFAREEYKPVCELAQKHALLPHAVQIDSQTCENYQRRLQKFEQEKNSSISVLSNSMRALESKRTELLALEQKLKTYQDKLQGLVNTIESRREQERKNADAIQNHSTQIEELTETKLQSPTSAQFLENNQFSKAILTAWCETQVGNNPIDNLLRSTNPELGYLIAKLMSFLHTNQVQTEQQLVDSFYKLQNIMYRLHQQSPEKASQVEEGFAHITKIFFETPNRNPQQEANFYLLCQYYSYVSTRSEQKFGFDNEKFSWDKIKNKVTSWEADKHNDYEKLFVRTHYHLPILLFPLINASVALDSGNPEQKFLNYRHKIITVLNRIIYPSDKDFTEAAFKATKESCEKYIKEKIQDPKSDEATLILLHTLNSYFDLQLDWEINARISAHNKHIVSEPIQPPANLIKGCPYAEAERIMLSTINRMKDPSLTDLKDQFNQIKNLKAHFARLAESPLWKNKNLKQVISNFQPLIDEVVNRCSYNNDEANYSKTTNTYSVLVNLLLFHKVFCINPSKELSDAIKTYNDSVWWNPFRPTIDVDKILTKSRDRSPAASSRDIEEDSRQLRQHC